MAGPDIQFWQRCFESHSTPWDRGAVNPQLEQWIRGGSLRPTAGATGRSSGSDEPRLTRVLVPGCGSGHEVAMLAEWGFDVTGVDYAPAAVELTRDRVRSLLRSSKSAHVNRVEVVEADILHYDPPLAFDAIYEQTCLCALHPDHWQGYAQGLHRWLVPGGLLLASFAQMLRPGAAQGLIEGPPYHCDINAMRALFPESRWHWPRPPFAVNPHPVAGLSEVALILTRRPD